jgi:hypothetical protein
MAVVGRPPISTPDDSRVECRRQEGLRPGQTEVLQVLRVFKPVRVFQLLRVLQMVRGCLDRNQESVGR